ncbi:UTRA domain-containing protein [Streptomyces goshikiensis]|uniref:UTRA domain-containing protein n=1 Tax=Streptomyces goshikiensis TaxID=1942 RepID=UPI0036C9EAF7
MASNTISDNGAILRDARTRYARRAQGGAHGAFEAETKDSGKTPRAEVEVSRSSAPAAVAEILGQEAGTEVVVRARRMFADSRLVQLCDTFIPSFVADAAPAVAQLDTGEGGIISRMAEADLAQTEVTEDIDQRPATAEQAEALGVEAGTLLLTITHVGRTSEGKVVEVSVHTLGPGWTLRYGVPLA